MDNKPANITLGVIALTADLLGIIGFIVSGEVAKFWSATWMVYIFGLTLLMAAGFFFFSQAKEERVTAFYPLAAGIYAVLSCIAIAGLFAGVASSEFTIGGFLGMVVLALFPAAMALAIASLTPNPGGITKTISYFYAAAGIFAVIFMLLRYAGSPGYSWSMLGELIGLALIGGGFMLFAFFNEKT